jgi:transposase
MTKVTLLGIDLAKNIFQLHGVNEAGMKPLKKKLKREQLMEFVANFPKCTIAMEACSGSSYWARKFKKLGHEAKLISPQFVKPFVKTNKTDANDAEAIVIAARQEEMRFVPINSEEEQDVQSIHRMRERLIGERTGLINQIRGLLSEYGIIAAQGTVAIKKLLAEIEVDDEGKIKITSQMKELCGEFYDELKDKEKRIKKCDIKIEAIANTNPICLNFMSVLGVGALTATILLTVLGDPSLFKNGRHFAAFLGLVPRQYSSGGKHKLYGISKRGDKYIRSLLVHGARSVLLHSKKKTDKYSQWAKKLNDRAGHNCTCVAIANKNARILWALAKNATKYKADYKYAA